MTDFAAPQPYNPEKPDELHARESLPAAPERTATDWGRYLLGVALGIAGTCIFLALAYQARAGWDYHREWVVAVTVPGAAIGGVCLGFLLARGKLAAAGPGIVLLLISAVLAGLNIWRGELVDGPDIGRDLLTIGSGVFLILAGHAFLFAEVWTEATDPVRPPKAE